MTGKALCSRLRTTTGGFYLVKAHLYPCTGIVQIDKYPLNDCNLSWKAKGLLAYLLSHPPDWQIIIEDLIAKAKDGRDSLYAGLKELEDNGYLKQEQLKNEQGKLMSVEYIIFERPQAVSVNSGYGKSGNGKTVSGKSDTTNNNNTKNKVTKNKVVCYNLPCPTK